MTGPGPYRAASTGRTTMTAAGPYRGRLDREDNHDRR